MDIINDRRWIVPVDLSNLHLIFSNAFMKALDGLIFSRGKFRKASPNLSHMSR
jgi:hypothetical protein